MHIIPELFLIIPSFHSYYFILLFNPSVLPMYTPQQNVPESHYDNIKNVYFYLPDGFYLQCCSVK